jgi:hypothetical protein
MPATRADPAQVASFFFRRPRESGDDDMGRHRFHLIGMEAEHAWVIVSDSSMATSASSLGSRLPRR